MQKLKEYTVLVVRLVDGSRAKGSFVAADADDLTVLSGADSATYARPQVKEVRLALRAGWHKGVGFFLGAVLGAVAGAILGYRIDYPRNCGCDDPGLHGLIVGFWGGLISGAVLGYSLGGKGDGPVVYRAPRA